MGADHCMSKNVTLKEVKENTWMCDELQVWRLRNANTAYSTICFHVSGIYSSYERFQ